MKPGAGERVFYTLMSLVEGADMTLEVASTNQRAIRLYEKLELPGTGEDFGTLRKQLHEAYNLLKRKGK